MLALVGDGRTRVGIDIVQISRIADSLSQFGDRFTQRLFTSTELADVAARLAPGLAECFAAKEAALKALDLCEAGIDWREMEVRRLADGTCRLQLHGKAAELAGVSSDGIALSLSQDGHHAMAVVTAASSFLPSPKQ
ncbi:holo-ACP synthase [Piscinibacter terrae]|uniref:holo-ACP synthase n=1 Tax=Piscinibacter terrae TaxID=2496871 RepID=UPI001386675E|nr:holo-ACP synthase [Albitalea terrae]